MSISPARCLEKLNELQEAKNYNAALTYASRILRKFPDNGDIAVAVAKLYETVKHYDVALKLVSRVVAALSQVRRPVPPGVLLSFGELALRNHRVSDARHAFEKLLPTGYRKESILVGLASVALQEKRFDDAENLVSQAIDLTKDNRNARFVLAEIFLAKNRDEDAIELLEQNIRKPPPHGESIDLWLSTLKKLNRDRYAQETLEELSQNFPKVLEFSYGFGTLAHRAGEYSAAREALRVALELSPENNRILHELAILERLAGNIEKSMDYAERTLTQNPENPAALRTHAMEHQFCYGDPAFSRLLKVSANYANFSDSDQIQLHFALGKAFDDVADYEVAFKHYAVGGLKHQKLEPYDRREAEKVNKMLIRYITRENLEKTNDQGTEDETPVFILGMPRSGTSLLEQILASHPDIYGAGELKYLGGVIENMIINSNAIHIGEKDPIFTKEQMIGWAARGDRYIQQLRKLSGNAPKRIVDKMPGNYNYVGMIHALMPRARIIHSQRHPVDTCLSCYRILFSEGQLWSYELTDLAHQYRKYWNIMSHWRDQFPGRMYEVFYEQTVADVEGQARALIAHLGLPWNDNCLKFYETDRAVKTASASQVRKPIYTSSAYRWKKYEQHLSPLIEELSDIIEIYEEQVKTRIESRQFSTL